MIGLSCDYCRKFCPLQVTYSMFGPNQVTPPGWITLAEQERPQQLTSSFLATFTPAAPEPPAQPLNFCSWECSRDYLRAKTLIDGPVAS